MLHVLKVSTIKILKSINEHFHYSVHIKLKCLLVNLVVLGDTPSQNKDTR